MPRIAFSTAIAELAKRDNVLAGLVKRVGPVPQRPRTADGPFAALVRSIVFQQLNGRVAMAILGRVKETTGALTPEAIAKVTDDQLRAAGLSWAKVASLRDLSEKVASGEVPLERMGRMSDEDVTASLTSIRGIGKWSAEMFLMFELRRLDIWPVEDLGVRQGYGIAWGIDPPPKPKELMRLGEPFHPYRTILALYCWEATALAKGGDINLSLR